ncbi:hypothetical protein [Mycoplana rhizolycopersici]|uniref:Uncharacterized protein n=1 Tax=Mycoplana rhizolycopersici TaxID=2746702 RepID=A0ABX2QII3_9HYPH|nr:hypothetical protein [Rhizobium rhizolycopersici]NVP57575.1 hypothetical protein [Rhizobium rhizolycopersici]
MKFVKFVRAKDGADAYINPEKVAMVTVVNGVTMIRTTAGGDYASVGVQGDVAVVAMHLQMANSRERTLDKLAQ